MDFDEDPNYLDLDDILAQTQLVDCTYLINIPGLEFLSPESSIDAKQGTTVSLPFWMAKTLYAYSMIDITLPKSYNASTREILEAGPCELDLHRQGPHYYRFGLLLMGLRREKGNNLPMFTEDGQRNKYRREEGEMFADRHLIANSLVNTFHCRRHRILDFSTRPPGESQQVRLFESRLDNLEKRLFRLGRQHLSELNRWRAHNIDLNSLNTNSNSSTKRMRF